MKPIIDLQGHQFDDWTVLAISPRRERGIAVLWTCECVCGVVRDVLGASLRGNRSRGCGCRKNAEMAAAQTKHGHAKKGRESKTYQCWKHIIQRCYNPNSEDYQYYGGRGIGVCQRWFKFENFIADMGECPPRLTIDRIDNDGRYEKGNCRWATRKQQVANKRGNFVKGQPGLRGEDAPSSKLTEVQVAQIRTAVGAQRNIAKKHSVSQSLVSLIRNNKVWESRT